MEDWKEYNYLGHKARGGAVSLRPHVLTKIFYGGRKVEVFGLIDSGSDHTLINAEIADILGIDLSNCLKLEMGGVLQGTTQASIAKVRMEVDKFDEEIELEAKFVPGMTIDVILGQSDFFEKFKVCFEKNRGKFYLAKA